MEAIELLTKLKAGESVWPDIILLDLNLPRKDGREVLLEIKSDEALNKIPVVVLSSSRAAEDIKASYLRHANCYITKPLDFHEFLHVVHALEDFWFTVVRLPGPATKPRQA